MSIKHAHYEVCGFIGKRKVRLSTAKSIEGALRFFHERVTRDMDRVSLARVGQRRVVLAGTLTGPPARMRAELGGYALGR